MAVIGTKQCPRPGFLQVLKPYLDPVCRDRPQEIVFIGAKPMDEAKIRGIGCLPDR